MHDSLWFLSFVHLIKLCSNLEDDYYHSVYRLFFSVTWLFSMGDQGFLFKKVCKGINIRSRTHVFSTVHIICVNGQHLIVCTSMGFFARPSCPHTFTDSLWRMCSCSLCPCCFSRRQQAEVQQQTCCCHCGQPAG